MGSEVILKCLNCGRRFKRSVGGGFNFGLPRCVKCDSTKSVEYIIDSEGKMILPEGLFCGKCGSEMREDIEPMCPFCHSRSNEDEEILIMYD